jgi:hypothetical protein
MNTTDINLAGYSTEIRANYLPLYGQFRATALHTPALFIYATYDFLLAFSLYLESLP